jgi:hypothetical protein
VRHTDMPKWGIHHVVLEDAIGILHASSSSAAQQAAADLFSNKDIAMLGAVGPDLFFWAPDYEAVKRIHRLYKNIEFFIDLYNKFTQPIRDIHDAVVEPVEDAVETLAPNTINLIRHLLEEMNETVKLFKSTLYTGIFAGVVDGLNDLTNSFSSIHSFTSLFFQLFVPPLQHNLQEKEWYWFDMLHYRNTGDFASKLVDNATTPRERAYAYGYLSHIATDLVGHAFVNQVVGGPYRTQSQRHVVVENFMDCWKFQQYYGESVNLTLLDKLGVPEVLPSDIRDLIHKSFSETYPDLVTRPQKINNDPALPPEERGFLTREQINHTYEVFFDILRIMKKMAVPRPEEPFSGVADILSEALNDLLEPPPSPPSSPSGACSLADIFSFGLTPSSRECYANFFDHIETWLEYIGELLSWAFETLLDLFDLLLSLLLSLPIVVLLAILYGVQLLLYEIYQTIRSVLALEGLVYPEPDDLNTSHGRNLTTTFQCPALAPQTTSLQLTKLYPKKTNLTVSHLVCPPCNPDDLEYVLTLPDFNPASATVIADAFIKNRPFSESNLIKYANSDSPAITRDYQRKLMSIGNATDLTGWMIKVAHDAEAGEDMKKVAFTNWNLDSDRGYGYKVWRGTIPQKTENDGTVSPEVYI